MTSQSHGKLLLITDMTSQQHHHTHNIMIDRTVIELDVWLFARVWLQIAHITYAHFQAKLRFLQCWFQFTHITMSYASKQTLPHFCWRRFSQTLSYKLNCHFSMNIQLMFGSKSVCHQCLVSLGLVRLIQIAGICPKITH